MKIDFKKKKVNETRMSKYLFIYQWITQDESDEFVIKGFGITPNGEDVCISVKNFKPWLSIEGKEKHQISNLMEDVVGSRIPYEIMDLREQKKLYFSGSIAKVYRIYFPSMETRKSAYYRIKKKRDVSRFHKWIKIHDYEASPLLQFLCRYNLPSCGWIEYKHILQKIRDGKYTRHSTEIHVDRKHILPVISNVEDLGLPFMRCLSFDIETYSSNELKMPDYCLASDVIFQIGVSVLKSPKSYENILFTLTPEKISIPQITVFGFKTERELLQAFCDYVKSFNPHVMLGFNIFGFDIPYLYNRCKQKAISLESIGMPTDMTLAEYKEIKWSSSAYSVQQFHFLDLHGRISIDLLPVIKRDYKLNNYKLKTISTFFLGETKDPLTVKDIFEAYRLGVVGGNMKKLKLCGKYCVKDAELVLSLFEKLQIWIGLLEMARICNTGIMTLFTQGQQIKVFSQVYKKCFEENRLVDSFDSVTIPPSISFEFENYCGAYVFDPIPGKYEWITPFDFSSLYPTTIIAFNIDYSTLVVDKSVPDTECNVIEWKEGNQQYRFRFRKSPLGVIPSLLQSLLSQRNATKLQLKKTKDKVLKIVLNERQKAYKVSANSMYGAMGVSRGYLPFLPGAMCTTAMGRESIQKAAKFVETSHGGKIIYGDSCSKDTVLYLRRNNSETTVHVKTIQEYFKLFPKRSQYPQFKENDFSLSMKEKVEVDSNDRILTHRGWSNIKRIIRHKCQKNMFRVYTSSGSIEVTEDHSLLLENGTMIPPTDLVPNEHQLMTIDKHEEISSNIFYEKESWDGFFTQKVGKICFDKDMSEKYISYIYYTYKQKFPNCCFVYQNGRYFLDLFNAEVCFPKGLVYYVEKLPLVTDYVYDIETEEGSFHAGNGELIIKNTDSIYCHFPKFKTAKNVWKNAKETEKEFLKIFPPPMKLLFEEKIYKDFLILSKKRYMCITCDENGAIDEKMTIRGVLLARRDNSSWTREFYEKIVRLIMEEKKISCEEILNIINQDILQLLQWDQSTTDINQFVITKTLNDSYKVRPIDNDEKKAMKRLRDLEIEYPEKLDISLFNQHVGAGKSKVPFIQEYINRSKPAHVQLSQRMTERGLPISVGSRMEYIVIEHSQDPNTKMFEKLEDPTYFCDHCDVVRMDRLYYVKSIVIPVDQLLETVFKRKNMVKEIYDHHVKHLKLMKEWKSLNSKKLLYR